MWVKFIFNLLPHILLDVVFDEIPHTDIIKVPIENDWVSTEDPIVEAAVSSIDSILGDKLTAFDPSTIGVPYNKDKDVEIIKQLKQNFPLKYFLGDNVNAIEIQIWAAMLANLLISLVKSKLKHNWAFSNMVSIIRQQLMDYINILPVPGRP